LAFNNVFGYYLEVRNSHKDKVPEAWHRKQTLVNAERYITDELKKFEVEVLGAEEKIKAIETQLFEALVAQAAAEVSALLHSARWVATLDVLLCFSEVALKNDYVRPTFTETQELEIRKGRHPVIEKVLPEGQPYIANSLEMNAEASAIAMITGPNMSGKSALLRQTALIQILAQIGAFVPAKSARLPIMDRLFVRVGASDNLSKGESTFMVEMNETATILNNISPRSLVILDEIGRGTSTFDGVSIAWGIAEYLHQHPAQPLVLFATHYHELNEMAHEFSKVRNYHVAAEEHEDTIVFTRQLKPGGTAHSFGLHVAKLAGIPGYVVHRATQVLGGLEAHRSSEKQPDGVAENGQLNFFSLDRPELEEVADELIGLNLDELKPIEALMLLHTLKEKVSKK
jgi:DNA mismatch repair protein MutS